MLKNRLTQVLSLPGTIRVLKKHWIGTAAIAIVGSLGSYFVVRALPSRYRSETVILVESQKIPEKLVSSTVNDELQDRLATLSQEILSSTRLQTVIEKFNMYPAERKSLTRDEVLEQMKKDINIKLERGWTRNQPGAFRISLLGADPVQITAVVNQLSNYFIEDNLRARNVQAQGTSEFLTSQLDEAKKVLAELESRVAAYKVQHSGELPEQQQSLLAAIASLQVQLNGNQDTMLRAEQSKTTIEGALVAAETTRKAIQQAMDSARTATRRSGGVVAVPPGTVRPLTDLEIARKTLDDLKLRYTEKYPEVQTMTTLVARLESMERSRAAQAEKNAGAGESAEVIEAAEVPAVLYQSQLQEGERITTLKAQLESINQEIKVRQADHDTIVANLASYQRRTESLPLREQDMASLKRDYDISRSNYESLLKKSLEADMASDMEKRQKAERFMVLDAARVPEKPTKPNRPVFYAAGVLASIGLGLLFSILRELQANVILGEWDLPADVHVLGRVPKIHVDMTPGAPRAVTTG